MTSQHNLPNRSVVEGEKNRSIALSSYKEGMSELKCDEQILKTVLFGYGEYNYDLSCFSGLVLTGNNVMTILNITLFFVI